jgi:glycosyltransferase involved in cell wall biosynthesis
MVQPHGVPAARFAADQQDQARRAFPQLQGRPMLLVPGRVDPVKNQDWVAGQMKELLRRHPDLVVVSVGPCTHAAYGQTLERRLRDEGLENHFILAGKLPPGDPRLIGLMQMASAVLLPSLSETFGLVILEAWAAGTPVISSRTSGALSLVEPGVNGWLFDLSSPEQFHGAVDALLSDSSRSRAMGGTGRALVRREYDSVVLARRMQRLYQELSAEAAGPSVGTPSPCVT